MQEIKKESNQKNPDILEKGLKEIQRMDSVQPSLEPIEVNQHSPNLSVIVSTHLLSLMKEVSQNVTPQSVNAACNCAASIYKFISLNVKLKERDRD